MADVHLGEGVYAASSKPACDLCLDAAGGEGWRWRGHRRDLSSGRGKPPLAAPLLCLAASSCILSASAHPQHCTARSSEARADIRRLWLRRGTCVSVIVFFLMGESGGGPEAKGEGYSRRTWASCRGACSSYYSTTQGRPCKKKEEGRA